MKRHQLYLSTIDSRAGELARAHGLGVEITQFCTAWNYDNAFEETDAQIMRCVENVPRRVIHGPFNELFPCAIDPLARKLASLRFSQTLELAQRYGAGKIILHGGCNPRLYYPVWYVEQSVIFWREFLRDHPGDYRICLENVLEDTPELLLEIAEQVADPRLRLCLDVGHVNAYSPVAVSRWIECWGNRLSHVHAHNNDGRTDTHCALSEGSLPMKSILSALPEEVSVTLEIPDAESSLAWLQTNDLI